MNIPAVPQNLTPLLRACSQENADVQWRGEWYELCGQKAFVLIREYWRWTVEVADQQRPQMTRDALKHEQATQPKRLTPAQRDDVIKRVEERIAAFITREDAPVRARHAYNPYAETRQPEGWDQLEQRLRDLWGPLWAESMTWPNPLWEQKEIDWAWLDVLTGKTEHEPVSIPDVLLRTQEELF